MDLETNHPNKLFRAITDLFDELESAREYDPALVEEPRLEETPIGDVANFKGRVGAAKTLTSYHKGRIVAGIIIAVIGAVITIFPTMGMNRMMWLDPMIILFVGIGMLVIGVIIGFIKVKTDLNIAVYLTGESYGYKGHKETTGTELEKRERLDVVSDVRITLKAYPSLGSYFKPEYKEILNDDLIFLYSKLNKIVPQYRIPSST